MPSPRQHVFSESPYEAKVGFSRAVRVGPHIAVAGTAAIESDGSAHAPNDGYTQALFIFNRMRIALEELGASLADVTRTRMYLADPEAEAGVSKAHLEVFGEIRPAATMITIAGLVVPGLVVEIEADAIVGDG